MGTEFEWEEHGFWSDSIGALVIGADDNDVHGMFDDEAGVGAEDIWGDSEVVFSDR